MGRVLVTGGSGFVGSAVVRRLQEQAKHEVRYTYRSEPLAGVPGGLKLDLLDLDGYTEHTSELDQVTHLIHAAAVVSHDTEDVLADLETQVIEGVSGLRNLLSRLPSLQKIVYVSSCSAAIAHDDPFFYGLGKLMLEEVVSRVAVARRLDAVSLRFPQIYGPGEPHGTFVSAFLRSLRQNETIELVNDGSVVRDILYIDDVVGSITFALDRDVNGLFTITDPTEHTVREVLDELAGATRCKPTIHSKQLDAAEVARKSVHFESTAADMGYKIRYNLSEGVAELVAKSRKGNDV